MKRFFSWIRGKLPCTEKRDMEYLCRSVQHLKDLYDSVVRAPAVLSRASVQREDLTDSGESCVSDRSHPLDFSTLLLAELALGRDLRGVKVHTGPKADSKARSMGAKAFASGEDIYFREGAYDWESDEGRCRLVHELTHAAQFKEGKSLKYREDRLDWEEEAEEREAVLKGRELGSVARDSLGWEEGSEWSDKKEKERLIRITGRAGQVYVITEKEKRLVIERVKEHLSDWIGREWETFDESGKRRIMDRIFGMG